MIALEVLRRIFFPACVYTLPDHAPAQCTTVLGR